MDSHAKIGQYRTAVESADRFEDRRVSIYKGFFLLLSGLVVALGLFLDSQLFEALQDEHQSSQQYWGFVFIIVAGITLVMLGLSWWIYARSSNRESGIRWETIREMESDLEIVIARKADKYPKPARRAKADIYERSLGNKYELPFPFQPFYRYHKYIMARVEYKIIDPYSLSCFLIFSIVVEILLFLAIYIGPGPIFGTPLMCLAGVAFAVIWFSFFVTFQLHKEKYWTWLKHPWTWLKYLLKCLWTWLKHLRKSHRLESTRWNDWKEQLIEEFRSQGGHPEGMPILLLHHTDAITGARRVSPVPYQNVETDYAIFASTGGHPTKPDWYCDLMATKRRTKTKVEVGKDILKVRARIAEDAERERIWAKQKAIYTTAADYEASTSHRIPVVVLDVLCRCSRP